MFSMGVCVGGLNCFSSIRFFATLWIIADQAPTSEISQARKLEWVSMPSSRGSSQPRDWTLCLLGLLHWQVESLAPALLRVCSEVKSLSRVRLFVTPWTVPYKAPLSMEFSRHEYWSGLPFPSPGDLPHPGIKPGSPTLQAEALPSELPESMFWV